MSPHGEAGPLRWSVTHAVERLKRLSCWAPPASLLSTLRETAPIQPPNTRPPFQGQHKAARRYGFVLAFRRQLLCWGPCDSLAVTHPVYWSKKSSFEHICSWRLRLATMAASLISIGTTGPGNALYAYTGYHLTPRHSATVVIWTLWDDWKCGGWPSSLCGPQNV